MEAPQLTGPDWHLMGPGTWHEHCEMGHEHDRGDDPHYHDDPHGKGRAHFVDMPTGSRVMNLDDL